MSLSAKSAVPAFSRYSDPLRLAQASDRNRSLRTITSSADPHCVPAKRRAIATNTTGESPRRAGGNSLAVSFRVAVTIAAAVVSISAFAGRQDPLSYFLQWSASPCATI